MTHRVKTGSGLDPAKRALLEEKVRMAGYGHMLEPDADERLLFADGMEDAVLGVCEEAGVQPRMAYSYAGCLRILRRDGGTALDAEEHMQFNVMGSRTGPDMPVYITLFDNIKEKYHDVQFKNVP